ncbi:ribonuclease T2 family protein [Algicella marina]|uniref:Ribonuclease T n=1 Tax=Algicella marina TaxID=2683284 RepID=A0A6P1SZW2_9RHOB|nr:ribonuclease T2 [Algicella marina]QHQ33782.1 ribonuclease T [Algicella marina]
MWRYLALLLVWPFAAIAEGERAGDFDYYVMALSWSPSWCALEGDARNSDQCDARHDHGFTLHGLWPQYDDGYPSYCRTTEKDPSRTQTAEMTDIMGSGGLAWHQWEKHGRCTGLSASDYFDLSRAAYESIKRPEVFRKLPRTFSLPPKVIEEAFLEENDTLLGAGVTVTCKSGLLAEVRICLEKDLSPRICGRDVQQDCSSKAIEMDPIR